MLLWTVVVLFLVIGLATKAAADEDSAAELRRRAEKSYAQIAPCLQSAWIYQAKYHNAAKNHTFSFPDDAQAHFEQVKKALARFATTAHMHTYRHYSGPWIENIFISHFQKATLKDLHGIIPLFVPWVDNQRTGDQLWQEIFKTLKAVLRPDVIYLAVSQGDIGLAKIGEYFPNVLVLSGGGFGHVPVPLIKGLLPYNAITQWPPHWDQEIGFFGNLHQATRPIMFDTIRAAADKAHMTHKIAFGPTWMDMMAKSKFNLAPRGFGRSSFRFAEYVRRPRVAPLRSALLNRVCVCLLIQGDSHWARASVSVRRCAVDSVPRLVHRHRHVRLHGRPQRHRPEPARQPARLAAQGGRRRRVPRQARPSAEDP